jgi:P-type E1-E2 ATPase
VRALQARGETVGFLGDGVNDAPGIRIADVGLSVDGATGVARAAADMILLAPDLNVVADGVEEGRRTFGAYQESCVRGHNEARLGLERPHDDTERPC